MHCKQMQTDAVQTEKKQTDAVHTRISAHTHITLQIKGAWEMDHKTFKVHSNF